jgi:hypothetical protein
MSKLPPAAGVDPARGKAAAHEARGVGSVSYRGRWRRDPDAKRTLKRALPATRKRHDHRPKAMSRDDGLPVGVQEAGHTGGPLAPKDNASAE